MTYYEIKCQECDVFLGHCESENPPIGYLCEPCALLLAEQAAQAEQNQQNPE